MTLFCAKNSAFDISSAEFFFFYIDDYKMFQKQGFCLNPQYRLVNTISKKNDYYKVQLEKKKDFVNLFETENVNLMVLCGMNGCGKSTVLNLLADKTNNTKETFLILRDKNENFASTFKCKLILDKTEISLDTSSLKNDYIPAECCMNPKNAQLDYNFNKNLTYYYAENSALFDGVVEGKLFTHFTVELYNFDIEFDELINGNRRALFVYEDLKDLKLWFESDFISFYLLITIQDRSCDAFVKRVEDEIINYKTSLKEYFTDFIYSFNSPEAIERLCKKIFDKKYALSDLRYVEKLLDELDYKISEFIDNLDISFYDEYKQEKRPRDYIYFKGYSNETTPYRYLSDLSNGEYLSLKYRYEIFRSMTEGEGFWWFIDEPEKSLHPEWSRTFLSDYLNAYKNVRQYMIDFTDEQIGITFDNDKKFSIIFATHSPFLLSDVTNDYIIYLEKTGGKTVQVTGQKDVFAGNIGEMYNTNFFMQNTIGEFARSKLTKIITIINNNEKVSKEVINNWKLLVSKIGDDLLRKLLTDKIEMYEKSRIK